MHSRLRKFHPQDDDAKDDDAIDAVDARRGRQGGAEGGERREQGREEGTGE